ncbi:MAG: DUF456 family protein [Syntrophales bacterium]|nr:DUF456 family protein [Syntrophales bacterium]
MGKVKTLSSQAQEKIDVLSFEKILLGLLIAIMFIGQMATIFRLPGTFVILFAASIIAILTRFQSIDWKILTVLIIISLIAEFLEFIVNTSIPYKWSLSGKAILISFLGASLGIVILSPYLYGLGVIIGGFSGALLGILTLEIVNRYNVHPALRFDLKLMFLRFLSTLAKGCLAMLMIIITLMRIYS